MDPSEALNAENSQEIQLRAHSPAIIGQAEISDRIPDRDQEEAPIARAPHTSRITGKELTCIFGIFVVIVFVLASTSPQQENHSIPTKYVFKQVQGDGSHFEFLVYCPHSYYDQKTSFRGVAGAKPTTRLLYQSYTNILQVKNSSKSNYDSNSTYLVEAVSTMIDFNYSNGTSEKRASLLFCGLVRFFNQTCSEAFIGCSSPGPMFDIPTRSYIDVIWVNNFDPKVMPDATGTCLSPCEDNGFCSLQTKISRSSQTYQDVTIHSSFKGASMRVNSSYWPLSVHVHGAEIRPTFDGNPLSWWANNKQNITVGPASFSLDQQCYQDSFDKVIVNGTYYPPHINIKDPITGQIIRNFKINRYPNRQNPGILWYHDHAMHLTTFNVQYGLAGFYILRDSVVEAEIGVAKENERLLMLTNNNIFISWKPNDFVPNVVYRFRFLNMNFDDSGGMVMRVSFSYNYCNSTVPQLQSFSLIGADSSLFHQSIDGQTNFVLSQAERMDILIKFAAGNDHFSICTQDSVHPTPDTSVQQNDTLVGIKLGTHTYIDNNTRNDISNIVLSVAYTDLSLETNIPVIRMRPLVWVGRSIFTIHGRTDFHQGWSQNPTLGTVQDWFIINTIYFAHPIHIHLINFQIVKEYDLRTITTPLKNKCSIYQMDFIIQALKMVVDDSNTARYKDQILLTSSANTINYQVLCDNLYTISGLDYVKGNLSLIYPEHTIDANNVSGLDVRMKMTAQDVLNLNTPNFTISPSIDFADLNSYRYVSNGGYPSTKQEYKRWKDTANMEPFKVLQLRIRWTKSEFAEADRTAGKYFNIPNDQLREYPGFVYHCHILRHEDNEMMRPIMLQLPANAYLNSSTPCNVNSATGQPMLNWSDKFACINQNCGNPS